MQAGSQPRQSDRPAVESTHARQKYLPCARADSGTAICLAGAGTRAVGFLLGCIRRLNQLGQLSQARSISATGGGAIVAGQLAKQWAYLRADDTGHFQNFEDCVAGPLERFIRRGPKMGAAQWRRFSPRNWPKTSQGDFGAADLLAQDLDSQLYRRTELRRVASQPAFWFCGVNLATCGAWYYRQDRVGELLLGFTSQHRIRLAEAVAACSSTPLEMPPLIHRLKPTEFEGGVLGPKANAMRQRVHIASGLLDDTLAIEPVWRTHACLIVCDAGQWNAVDAEYNDWLGNRILRAMLVQQTALAEAQKRSLVLQLLGGSRSGAYVGLNAYHGHYGLPKSIGYPAEVVDEIGRMRTTLGSLSAEELMVLANHGYTLTDTAMHRYVPMAKPHLPCILPFPGFVDRGRVLGSMQNAQRENLVGRHAA